MSEFLVGIDLGTSNCAVAHTRPDLGPDALISDFSITQVRRPGETGPQALLPSAIYIPVGHEVLPETIALPWNTEPMDVVGEFARWQGARVPARLIVSAKSWLSHAGVDRSAAILPWGAPSDFPKISPVAASARLLQHMVESWNFEHPAAPLQDQEVVITVPASFDEIARALTVNAARSAGLEKFTLVEEPQAAFYDFTARHRHDLAVALQGVRLVLVVDVGGGTSDFTLVKVSDDQTLRRIAVGEHLMLGGDNMDAAIARRAEERMLSGSGRLSSTQWMPLVQASRSAKESLLGENPPATHHVSVVGEGSRLVGSSLSAQISREETEQIVLDGFFPYCDLNDPPQRGARVALQELGLPYAKDPAVTRQLALFLREHSEAGEPDAILLNGGVFNSARIASRLIDVVSRWRKDTTPLRVLNHDSLELAVARGAAYYGLVRKGMGRRIGGGTAHAFYVGLETSKSAPAKALCIVPRGHEEGETIELSGRRFNLTLGRPVQFPLFTSTSERVAASGEIVAVGEDLHPLPPIHTLLKGAQDAVGQVPVHLRATLTEIGTLELWCVSDAADERWRLEFELRGSAASSGETVIESMPARFSEARTSIEHIYGGKPTPGTPVTTNVKQLWRGLEKTLGPRDQWRVPVLRELWGALYAGAPRRRRSVDHERVWFQVTGYVLRPGFGYPLDDWRSEQIGALFDQSVNFHKEKPVWIEFWIMWRRIAGGLSEQRQMEIWEYLRPHLERRLSMTQRQWPKLKGIQPEGLDEMVRLAASLEHLPVSAKTELGDWIAPHVVEAGPWAWALGRIASRVPLYGSVHKTVEPAKTEEWLTALLDAHARGVEGALFASVQGARLSGDRSRDVDDAARERVLAAVQGSPTPSSWKQLLLEVVSMQTEDKARAYGDTLPIGLAA